VKIKRQGRCRFVTLAAALGFALAIAVFFLGANESQAAEQWKTGVEFRQQLEQPVDVHWADNHLRSSLARLAQVQGTAVFLDRRLDPDRQLQFDASNLSLHAALNKLAQQIQAGACLVGPVLYLGPQPTADKLATLAALRRKEAAAMPAAVKAKLLKQAAWHWDELSTPRELLEVLAKEGGLGVDNPQVLPHDLFPAVDLPPLPLVDRLSLLLAGFGLTFQLSRDGHLIRLVEIPAVVLLDKTYAARGDAAKLQSDLQRIFPDAKITRDGASVHVVAPYEDHDKIERLLSGGKVRAKTTVPGEKHYTLTVKNQPAGAVIKTVAKDLGKEMKYSPEVGGKLNEHIDLSVKEGSLDELLQATLKPLGLTYKLTDDALEIVMP
jgi:hypothetical protein